MDETTMVLLKLTNYYNYASSDTSDSASAFGFLSDKSAGR
jgi:hypothetical protein